jgi:hypothetical protein
MNQPSLFHEDVWQALTDCVRALGGAKKVGHKLRPELSPEKAGRWLLDCLNPAEREKLCIEQLLLILAEARDAGCHAGMTFIARQCGYAEPQPVEPEDERDSLMRDFIAASKEQAARQSRLEALIERTNARRR